MLIIITWWTGLRSCVVYIHRPGHIHVLYLYRVYRAKSNSPVFRHVHLNLHVHMLKCSYFCQRDDYLSLVTKPCFFRAPLFIPRSTRSFEFLFPITRPVHILQAYQILRIVKMVAFNVIRFSLGVAVPLVIGFPTSYTCEYLLLTMQNYHTDFLH